MGRKPKFEGGKADTVNIRVPRAFKMMLNKAAMKLSRHRKKGPMIKIVVKGEEIEPEIEKKDV